MIRWKVVTSFSELAAFKSAWKSLFECSENPEISLSLEWIQTWWSIWGHLQELRCVLFFDAEQLVGVAPMMLHIATYYSALSFKRLTWVGKSENALKARCGILAKKGMEGEIVSSFVKLLQSNSLGHWDELLLFSMDGLRLHTALLYRQLLKGRYWVDILDTRDVPWILLPSTWEEYKAQLSIEGRAGLEQSIQAFNTWSSGNACFEWVSSSDQEANKIWWAYQNDQPPSWKKFHEARMRQLDDAAEFLILRWHRKPVAILYNVVWHKHVYVYTLNTTVPSNIRLDVILHAEAIKRAIQNGYKVYEYCTEASPNALLLSNQNRPLINMRVARPGLLEVGRLLLEQGQDLGVFSNSTASPKL